MKLTDSELRLECLRLATYSVKPSDGTNSAALDVAQRFYTFMKEGRSAPSQRKPAALRNAKVRSR
jgi:hypothetical protein